MTPRPELKLIPGGAIGESSDAPLGADAPPTLEEAFRAHAAYVAGVAFRALGRSDEVDDVVQDVFIEAGRGLTRLREPKALRGWLAAIAVRVARRRLRRRRLRGWLGLDAAVDYEQVAAEGASPEQRAQVAEIYRCLDAVAAGPRLAWTLRHVEGLSLPEVATACGCSLATAKRWIAQVAARLEREIGHE